MSNFISLNLAFGVTYHQTTRHDAIITLLKTLSGLNKTSLMLSNDDFHDAKIPNHIKPTTILNDDIHYHETIDPNTIIKTLSKFADRYNVVIIDNWDKIFNTWDENGSTTFGQNMLLKKIRQKLTNTDIYIFGSVKQRPNRPRASNEQGLYNRMIGSRAICKYLDELTEWNSKGMLPITYDIPTLVEIHNKKMNK